MKRLTAAAAAMMLLVGGHAAAQSSVDHALKTVELDKVLACGQLHGKARPAHELGGASTPPALSTIAEAAPPPPAAPSSPPPVTRMTKAPAQTSTAPIPNAQVKPRMFHVYATADGESHIEELAISDKAGELPLTGMSARSYNPTNVGWHNAPSRQFAINLTGVLEVELSDGTKRRIGPGDLVLLEDTTGKGHVTRLVSPVTCLFIKVADGFDVKAWAFGAGR